MPDEKTEVDTTQLAPTTIEEGFEAFSAGMHEAGFTTVAPDPAMEALGLVDEDPELIAPGEQPVGTTPEDTPEVAAEADEATDEADDPFADLSAIERIDHRDSFSLLRTAGFSVDQLTGMTPRTMIQVAEGLRARQGTRTDSEAVKTALEAPAPEPVAFDLSSILKPVKEEFGVKGETVFKNAFEAIMGQMSAMTAEGSRKAAQHADGLRQINLQQTRLETANPGLSARPNVWEGVVETADALARTGRFGDNIESLFDVAAKAMGLDTTGTAKPRASTKDILKSQPRRKLSLPKEPTRSRDDWDFDLFALQVSGVGNDAAVKKLGPRPPE